MSKDNEKETQISLLILLATFKSFNEQLYNLKGSHSQKTKQYFNQLISLSKKYEKSINKEWLKDSQPVIDELYDAITDMIYIIRESVEKQEKK